MQGVLSLAEKDIFFKDNSGNYVHPYFQRRNYNYQDFNLYTREGSYIINTSGRTNAPDSGNEIGVLIVFVGYYSNTTKYITQLYITTNGNDTFAYVRFAQQSGSSISFKKWKAL